MRTEPSAFEERYKKRKAAGKPGWTDEKDYADKVAALEKLLKKAYVPKRGRLLELGCGAGNLTLWLAEHGFGAYGVDFVPTAIAWAKLRAARRGVKVDFRVGNVADLKGYENEFFDFVLDGACFHYIVAEDRKPFLASAHRVLKRGGFFHVGTTYGNEKVKTRLDMSEGSCFDPETRMLLRNGKPHAHIGLKEDILEEIRAEGFRILHWETSKREEKGQPFVEGSLLVDAVRE